MSSFPPPPFSTLANPRPFLSSLAPTSSIPLPPFGRAKSTNSSPSIEAAKFTFVSLSPGKNPDLVFCHHQTPPTEATPVEEGSENSTSLLQEGTWEAFSVADRPPSVSSSRVTVRCLTTSTAFSSAEFHAGLPFLRLESYIQRSVGAHYLTFPAQSISIWALVSPFLVEPPFPYSRNSRPHCNPGAFCWTLPHQGFLLFWHKPPGWSPPRLHEMMELEAMALACRHLSLICCHCLMDV